MNSKLDGGYFFFPQEIIRSGDWAKANKTLKAVLPILHFHSGNKGECHPGMERISSLAGVGKRSVARVIGDLGDIEGYKINNRSNGKTKLTNIYKCPKTLSDGILIKKDLIDLGDWANMSLKAKSIYIVLRYLAGPCPDSIAKAYYGEAGENSNDAKIMSKYDRLGFLNKHEISDKSGVSFRNVYIAIDELLKNEVLIKESDGYYKIKR